MTPLCAAPRSKELLQVLVNLQAHRLDAACLGLIDEPEVLAGRLLLAAPMADYGHMSHGLLLAIQEARGMQMMTGARAWSREEEVALEAAVRHAVAREGNAAYQASKTEEVAWVFRCIRENWHVWGGGSDLMRLLELADGEGILKAAGIEEICSPPCIGDNFQ